LSENAMTYFGTDVMWWLVPTHPELRINFLERVWPKRVIKRMISTEKYDLNEEHADPDKKLFSVEQKWSQFEKKIFWMCLILALILWFFFIQEFLASQFQLEKDIPKDPYANRDWSPYD